MGFGSGLLSPSWVRAGTLHHLHGSRDSQDGPGLAGTFKHYFGTAGVMALIGVLKRSSVVAVIAGSLVFAVPVASSQAFVPPVPIPLLVTAAVGGGEGVAGGSAAAAVCATGVGCAVLAAAVVGAGLYMTQDTWMPWVRNAFGVSAPSSTPGSGPVVYPMTVSFGSGSTMTAPNPAIIVDWITTGADCGSGCGDTYAIQGEIQCLQTNGTIITRSLGGNIGFKARNRSGSFTTTDTGKTIGCGTADGFNTSGTAGSTLRSFWLTTTAPQSGDVSNKIAWSVSIPDAGTRISTQVQCENPDGSTYSVTQAVDGVTGDLAPMPTCTGASGSQTGAHGKCVTLSAGPIGGTLVEQSSTCGTVAAQKALYPNCVGAGLHCTYVVRVDGLPCTVGAAACVRWAETYVEDPSRVSCRWGGYVVAMGLCKFLERVYEVQTTPAPGTALNTDGLPETYTAPGPAGQTTTQATPNAVPPAPAPAPVPNPTAIPGTIGSPNTPATAQERDCWPTGWGMFNPASWVMQPVKCAMSWAFVPRASTLTELSTTVKADLTTAGIAPIAAGVGSNLSLIGTGTGCAGPAVTFEAVGITKALHPFSACSEPVTTLATISRAVSTLVIVGVGGFAALRALGAGFGFNVSMGRGHSDS